MKNEIESLNVEIAILKEKIIASDKNLVMQAEEYQRRLGALNHEAEQLKTMQSTYLPREVYEMWALRVDAAIRELRSFTDTAQGKASLSSVYVAYLISAVGVLISLINLMK